MGLPSPSTSSAEQARQEALQLSQQRKEIDRQIDEHAQILKREGVNLTSSLLDAEGFPLNTVDIPVIREARSKIIALQNDRKDIDGQLRQLLEVALAAPPSKSDSSSSTHQELTSIAHSLETKSQTDTHLSDQTDTRSSTINNKSEWPAQKSCAGSSPCNLPSKRSTTQGVSARALVGSLAFLDRFLTVWIVLAMIIGVVIGEFADGVQDAFTSRAELQGVAAPLVVGLIVMMWPILTKVQYERFPEIFQSRGIWIHIGLSILLNWVVAPWVMTGLAWATLPDLEDFRTGIILVGIARCIAMVNIWAALAKGDTDVCAILVIINSLLQIVLFSPYSLLLINIVGSSNSISLNYSEVAKAVAIYLGIPLGAGILTRFTMLSLLGRKRFQTKFLPYFGPLSLVALLYVIIVIFALQAKNVLDNLGPTFRCFVPLIIYFILMWSSTFLLIYVLSRRHNKVVWNYEMAVVQSFTTGSNNFELAIAISVSTFGASSNQTLATTIGPLVEIPVLVILTYVSLFLGKRLTWNRSRSEKGREKMEERQEDTLQEA